MEVMDPKPEPALHRALAQAAPGTGLRDGLDRILQSGRGALIVIGNSPDVLNICSGGFLMEAVFSPQRLSELAKMDGAIILSNDVSQIARAAVHLVPNPNVPTSETGTRHRTAERVARSLNCPVIAVSESRKAIQVYVGDQTRQVLSASHLLERANQALKTLERYRARLDVVARKLSALEIQDLVTTRHATEVLQRAEIVVRISGEIEQNLVELGTDGRLVGLQLEELMGGVEDDRRLLILDYIRPWSTMSVKEAMAALGALDDNALFDDQRLAEALDFVERDTDVDDPTEARGFRLLSKLPGVNDDHVIRVVEHFGSLRKVFNASTSELEAVDGIAPSRAKALKQGTVRLAEESVIDRY